MPLFLNAKTVAEVLGISMAGAYELLHQDGFPVLRIGSRLVVPKEKFLTWVEEQAGGIGHE
nr:helix-turn-helix domain-containing protein [Acutalibacter sp. 1XD8-36]